ncbi:MAG TPA: hypothetical protein VM261_04110 [Kofleriaceae bacterium]|nr:hypothetical protein [Kofleriaceae bacterium]
MRRIILALGLLAAANGPAVADEELPDFDAIRTPDSPAFTLLGVSPTQIERPNTPKQLSAALSGFLSETGVAIPRNLAVEFSPYWLVSRPELELSEYMNEGYAQLWRNFTLSIGTSSTERSEMDPLGGEIAVTDTTLAVGARTFVRLSRPANCDSDIVSWVEASRTTALSQDPEYRDLVARGALTEEDAKRIKARIDYTAFHAAADRATKCLVTGADARGWSIEVAAATSVDFAGSDPEEGELRASAGWATLSHQSTHGSVVGLLRARLDEVADGRNVAIDPGIRGIYAKGRYAASAEVVGRLRVSETDMTENRDHTYRVALGFDLRLTDTTWFTVSFGKDFAADDTGKLFSLANVKWGFGDPKVKPDASTE